MILHHSGKFKLNCMDSMTISHRATKLMFSTVWDKICDSKSVCKLYEPGIKCFPECCNIIFCQPKPCMRMNCDVMKSDELKKPLQFNEELGKCTEIGSHRPFQITIDIALSMYKLSQIPD